MDLNSSYWNEPNVRNELNEWIRLKTLNLTSTSLTDESACHWTSSSGLGRETETGSDASSHDDQEREKADARAHGADELAYHELSTPRSQRYRDPMDQWV